MTDELRARLKSVRLYLVSRQIGDASLDAALRGGVELLQLAHPMDATDEDIITTGRRFKAICDQHGIPLLLNGRSDLVDAVGADGVHLNADDGGVARARDAVGPARLVGLWTKDHAEVDVAAALDVDYISVGPINITPTLPGRPAVGVELAAYAAAHSDVPVFAIGGIDASNVKHLIAAGVTRIAVLGTIAEASDPEQAAAELKAELV
jgi:thiamine-phosphate pyrophosphorylase